MLERFPGVDWYCDGCSEHLNAQIGFDDHKYTWRCTSCGYKSSISKANIRTTNTSTTCDDCGVDFEYPLWLTAHQIVGGCEEGSDDGGTNYCCGVMYDEGEIVCASCGEPL